MTAKQDQDQIEERMLALVYGLLEEDEAAALAGQIANEPAMAEAHARAMRAASVFGVAAKWHEAPVPMRGSEFGVRNEEHATVAQGAITKVSPGKASGTHTQTNSRSELAHDSLAGLRRAMQWAVAIATTVLFAFLLGGYLHHRGRLSEVAAQYLRVTVAGPSQLAPGVASQYQIKTTDVLGEPQSVKVQCALYDARGGKIASENALTGADGCYAFTCANTAAVSGGARLEVLALHRDEAYRLEAAMPAAAYRFTTRVATDKPLYRPGEVVRFRSVTLGRFGLDTPADLPLHFEVRDPSGAVVPGSEQEGITQRGVGNGEFALPPQRAGGEYRIVARSIDGAFAEEQQKFLVRDYRAAALKKELEFVRDSYTPGDRVAADLSVNKASGGPAAGAQLTITATVDGQVVHQAAAKANDQGACHLEFELPKSIERGDGQLAVACDDGGVRETIARSIPINTGKVELKFYPEGGDLVAGLDNRVYFGAINPTGKPVHVEGAVVDGAGREVAHIETKYKGMGSFWYTPAPEATYSVRLTKPYGVKSESKLPAAAATPRGVVLSTGAGVFDAGQPIEATLACPRANVPLVVAAYCRGAQVGQETLTTESGKNRVSLALPAEVAGVVRVTVYDYTEQNAAAEVKVNVDKAQAAVDDRPRMPRAVAERLVYRKPDRRLAVRVADHAERYSPGEKVELSLLCETEAGKPAKDAVLGVAVVDDSLLKLADDDTAAMPTHFYLTSEVENPEDLEKADFYLSGDPKANEALDLLLGTQGWRRFVERSLEDLHNKAKKAGAPANPEPPLERLLAMGAAALPPTVLDNLDDVRPMYERAREQAETDYRVAVGQLSRAAIYGGLILGALLTAVNVAPLLRQRQWDWTTAARRFAPAMATAAMCVVAGVLWTAGDWDGPESDLAAMAQFKLRPPAAAPDASMLATRDNLGANFNGASRHWYWGLGERWGDQMFADEPGMANEFAFMDMYRFDQRDLFFKLRGWQADARGEDAARWRLKYNRSADFDQDWTKDGWIALADQQRFLNQQGLPLYEGGRFAKLPAMGNQNQLLFLQRGGLQGFGSEYYFAPHTAVAGEYDIKALKKQLDEQIKQYRFPVREYAHQHVAGETGVRSDFAETVYWHPLLLTDELGRANVSFDLADSVTSYRVLAEAHDGGGRIGAGIEELFARLPFSVEPKLPLEVNAGDRIDVAAGVSNEADREMKTEVSCVVLGDKAGDLLRVQGETEDGIRSVPATLTLPAGGRKRTYFTLDVVGQKGAAEVEVRGTAGTLADAKRQTIRIVPPGFPVAESYAGRIDGEQQVTIDVPASVVPGTLEVTLSAYPSTIATLRSGLEGILREPNGCFEQASSSNYPNLLLLQYLDENKVSQPELTRRGKEFLTAGYAKLTGYECKSRGFEWFGADPGHEALTAYGLMEFRDMARVHDVDRALLDRTGKWLLGRRDGKGGFQRSGKKLDGFGSAPDHITNAYIVWALSESGQQGIETELAHTIEQARGSDDPYLVALAAASALNCKRETEGSELLARLTTLQAADGKLAGKEGSITRSGGEALAIETTALAALAWLKLPAFREQANRAIDWIVRSRSGNGGFGSTQATVLALKALVEHSKVDRGRVTAGALVVKHGDRVLGRQEFEADEVNTIKLAGFDGKLTAGENRLVISLTGENQMPYTIDVSYRANKPHSHPDCPLELTTKLASREVKAGQTVALDAELVNKTEQGQPMTMAILGLPAGLQPRADQLEELKKAGTIDYFETRAREVICYWRSLAPGKRVPVHLDLVAEWPGKYTGPASRAYLYYTAEQKQWADPLAVEIAR